MRNGFFKVIKLGEPDNIYYQNEDSILFVYGKDEYVLFGEENKKEFLENIKENELKSVAYCVNGNCRLYWEPRKLEEK